MVSIKSQLKSIDITVGMIYSQLRFPVLFIWIGIFGMNFYRECLPLILTGNVLFGCVLFLIYVLRLVAVMLFVGLFFAFVGKYTGHLKNQFKMIEYTFDGTTILSKVGEKDGKSYLDDIQSVYEDKKRIMLFKSGFKFEVISKRLVTESELAQIREFLKSKTSRLVHFIYRFLPYATLILAGLTAWGVFVPTYSMTSSTQGLEAFYQEDELAFTATTQSFGTVSDLYDGIFPPQKPKFIERKPFIVTRFFDVKGGHLTQLILTGHEEKRIFPSGPDLLCVSLDRKTREFLKFDGRQFVPVTGPEKDDLMKRSEYEKPSGWKYFRLWDETDQEIDENDPSKGEDNWATFPLKSGTVKVHYQSSIPDPKNYFPQHVYTLTGLTPNGGEMDLIHILDGTKKIDQAAFESDFPVKASNPGEGTP